MADQNQETAPPLKRYYYFDIYAQFSYTSNKYHKYVTLNYVIMDRKYAEPVAYAADIDQAVLIVDALNQEDK